MTLKEILERAKQNAANIAKQAYYDHEYRKNTGTSVTNNLGIAPGQLIAKTSSFVPKALGVGTNESPTSYSIGGTPTPINLSTVNPPPTTTVSTDPVLRNLAVNESAGDGSGGDGYSGLTEADIARQRYETRKREIESKLNAAKEYVKQLISGYEKTRDTTKGNIGTTYEGLKTLIGDKLKEAIGSLDQADVSVQNTYGRLSGNARRAMENVLTKNNLLAKAMGNAGSSWYQNLQAKSRNEGTTNIFDTEAEQASKRSAIETQKGATTSEFGQDTIEAEKEKVKLLGEADAKYNEDVAKAKLLEQNYGIDSEAAIDEAQANLDDAYRQINDYTSTRKAASETGTGYTDTTNKLKNYSALGKISDTINNNYSANKAGNYVNTYSGYNPGGTIGGSTSSPLSMYNPQSPNYFLNKKKKDEEDPSQYYIR